MAHIYACVVFSLFMDFGKRNNVRGLIRKCWGWVARMDLSLSLFLSLAVAAVESNEFVVNLACWRSPSSPIHIFTWKYVHIYVFLCVYIPDVYFSASINFASGYRLSIPLGLFFFLRVCVFLSLSLFPLQYFSISF